VYGRNYSIVFVIDNVIYVIVARAVVVIVVQQLLLLLLVQLLLLERLLLLLERLLVLLLLLLRLRWLLLLEWLLLLLELIGHGSVATGPFAVPVRRGANLHVHYAHGNEWHGVQERGVCHGERVSKHVGCDRQFANRG
jgi:hypothetical protein